MCKFLLTVALWSLIALLAGCVTATELDKPRSLEIAPEQLEWVGQQVFQNECNARKTCLVHWNEGEDFPSLGIGHFIWYPVDHNGPFVESFPSLVAYAQVKSGDLPDWVVMQAPKGAPWDSRDAFQRAEKDDIRIRGLREWLFDHQGVQAEFLMDRAQAALESVVAASSEPGLARKKVHALSLTPGGIYALIDYVNFKGEGLALSERYQGKGWGLLQVLEGMPEGAVEPPVALQEFRRSAAKVLTRRAELSGRAIEKDSWLPGWLNRVDTYREPSAF